MGRFRRGLRETNETRAPVETFTPGWSSVGCVYASLRGKNGDLWSNKRKKVV